MAVKQETFFQRIHMDFPMLFSLVVLTVIGLGILYSASGESSAMLQRQGIRLLAGFIVIFFVAQISPDKWFRWSIWFYTAGLVLLILVLVLGSVGKGAQRWLDLGLFRFQPSEIMKLAVPMMLARVMSDCNSRPSGKILLLAMALVIVPVLLIAKQPDLGTSLLVASSGLFVIFMAGVSWYYILGFIILAVAFSVPMWFYFMRDYQRQRILTMLDPESDPLGSGYHIIQSKIAIGSGGDYGKGWLNGTQSHLEFLPERHTDFIFSVFSEEFGLLGVGVLLSVYLFIIIRGLYMASQAQGAFSRLLGASIILTFLVYIFVNIGMVSGILPVVGVPLPLISYGGTSMVTLMAGFGLLMSIFTHRRMLAKR
jgi:rod shape determining protein RodA